MKKSLFLLVGPSGCGKSKIAEELEKKYNLKKVKNYTTRKKRPKENDDAYIFVDPISFNKFKDMTNVTIYNNNSYGSRLKDLINKDLYIVDTAGIDYMFKHHSDKFNLHVIGIKTKEDERIRRMKNRGDNESYIKTRIKNDREIFNIPESTYDLLVENNDLNTSVKIIGDYIKSTIKKEEQGAKDLKTKNNEDFNYIQNMFQQYENKYGIAKENKDKSIDILFMNKIAISSRDDKYPHSSLMLLQKNKNDLFYMKAKYENNEITNISIYALHSKELIFTVNRC